MPRCLLCRALNKLHDRPAYLLSRLTTAHVLRGIALSDDRLDCFENVIVSYLVASVFITLAQELKHQSARPDSWQSDWRCSCQRQPALSRVRARTTKGNYVLG